MSGIVERVAAHLRMHSHARTSIPSDEIYFGQAAVIALEASGYFELREALQGIKWQSADRDNMEFAARITCFQMDKIRAALAHTVEIKPDA